MVWPMKLISRRIAPLASEQGLQETWLPGFFDQSRGSTWFFLLCSHTRNASSKQLAFIAIGFNDVMREALASQISNHKSGKSLRCGYVNDLLVTGSAFKSFAITKSLRLVCPRIHNHNALSISLSRGKICQYLRMSIFQSVFPPEWNSQWFWLLAC